MALHRSNKHSSFSTSFPIYLQTHRVEFRAVEEPEPEDAEEQPKDETPEVKETSVEDDEDEVVIEDVTDEPEPEKPKVPETVPVTVEDWTQLNSQPPLWMR